jgi:hypothetical protein
MAWGAQVLRSYSFPRTKMRVPRKSRALFQQALPDPPIIASCNPSATLHAIPVRGLPFCLCSCHYHHNMNDCHYCCLSSILQLQDPCLSCCYCCLPPVSIGIILQLQDPCLSCCYCCLPPVSIGNIELGLFFFCCYYRFYTGVVLLVRFLVL